ncbi:HPr(Ser) kinase/phosphatase [Clostridiisalibacter paucivorans]|uniref:HPr(Ser) kinase/phosphatase n=1 Tax=Clostridiisalibacter paucivorans TaxID=408753 RepID=UPI00047EB198|nr:HPr(Ser) kinase/phosphatase [Clostridiisalibacter paucivorans]
MKSLTIDRLIKDMKLQIIYKPEKIDTEIIKSDINRPGLQLAGYFDHFVYDRLQIIGKVESSYLETLDKETKEYRLNRFFSAPIPALIVSRKMEVDPYMIECAKKYKRPILTTEMPTTKFISKIIGYIDDMLAPSTTIHGVLVDVYGIGILIVGKSGVGKSETALELIKRGHRLVADDAVEIIREEEGKLKGMAPELIRHFLEIRGLGILDIKRLYGIGAVRAFKTIELVIELEYWDEEKSYDRVGLDEDFTEILNTKLPKIVIPVKPGRNLAMIMEVAAKNHRQKQMGYNAAVELNNKLMKQMGFSE